jgi:hypothetical protein
MTRDFEMCFARQNKIKKIIKLNLTKVKSLMLMRKKTSISDESLF